MHPLLAGRLRVLLYLALWGGIAALLAVLLSAFDQRRLVSAVLFTGPLTLVYAFLCLSAFWVCRANPLRGAPWLRLVSVFAGAALPSALVLTLLGAGWGALLRARPGFVPEATGGLRDLAVVFVAGVVLYAQSMLAHYLFLAFEASRLYERRLLEAEVSAREAELRALRAQINPHFLFNSLNSISALVGADPEAARRMTALLGDFLRTSLALGARPRVSLAEELRLAERYLAVERVRFGERLSVEREVEAAAERFSVPPLILQPLIENAVKHGIAGCVEGGRIRIAVRRTPGGLEIEVENPFDESAVTPSGERLGLENVRKRLATLDTAGLELQRGNGLFRATLRLPLVEA